MADTSTGKHSPGNIYIQKTPEPAAPDDKLFRISWKFALAGVLVLLIIPISIPIVDAMVSGWDALGYFIVISIAAGSVSLILFIVSFMTGIKIAGTRKTTLWWLVPIGLLLLIILAYMAAAIVLPYWNPGWL